MPEKCAIMQLQIAPQRIHFLKFILEGYDGLALLSTVDRKLGLVQLYYLPEMKEDLVSLLDTIKPQLQMQDEKDDQSIQ